MNYYIVEDIHGDWNKLFLVKANNKKEALDIVWKRMSYDKQESENISGYKPKYKKEFNVKTVDELCLEEDNNNCTILV
jgi:hypothetical protein